MDIDIREIGVRIVNFTQGQGVGKYEALVVREIAKTNGVPCIFLERDIGGHIPDSYIPDEEIVPEAGQIGLEDLSAYKERPYKRTIAFVMTSTSDKSTILTPSSSSIPGDEKPMILIRKLIPDTALRYTYTCGCATYQFIPFLSPCYTTNILEAYLSLMVAIGDTEQSNYEPMSMFRQFEDSTRTIIFDRLYEDIRQSVGKSLEEISMELQNLPDTDCDNELMELDRKVKKILEA